MPNVDDLRNQILKEAHGSRYLIHPDSTKMYHDLRDIFWFDDLKGDIVEFVGKCPNFQHMKVEHLNQSDLFQVMKVHTGKWKNINMDLVVSLPWTRMQYYSIWVVVDRLTKPLTLYSLSLTYSAEEYSRIYIN